MRSQREKVEKTPQVFLTGQEHFFLPTFQGQELLPDARRGIMINERSLVIQRVDRAAAGAYVCQATNSAGTGASAEVALNVKCELIESRFLSSKSVASPEFSSQTFRCAAARARGSVLDAMRRPGWFATSTGILRPWNFCKQHAQSSMLGGSMTCHRLTSQQCKIHQTKFNKKSIHQIPIQQ